MGFPTKTHPFPCDFVVFFVGPQHISYIKNPRIPGSVGPDAPRIPSAPSQAWLPTRRLQGCEVCVFNGEDEGCFSYSTGCWFFTNPSEKYAKVKLDHETPGIGVKIKNTYMKPPPSFVQSLLQGSL